MFDCPQCGEETEEFYEGYCKSCCGENQRILDEHNTNYYWWQKLTNNERDQKIKSAIHDA